MAASLVTLPPDAFSSDRGLRGAEVLALALAVLAHLAVAVLLLRHPASPPPAPPQRMEVTLADDVGLQASAPQPRAPATTDLAPALGVAQPAPAPLPTKVAPAKPVAKPAPVSLVPEKPAKTTPTKPQAAKPQTSIADPVAAALAATAAAHVAHKPAKPAGGSRIGADWFQGSTSASTTGKAAASAAVTGPVKAALASALSRQLKPHWVAPEGVDADQLITILTFDLNADGTLAGPPRVVRQDGIDDSNRAQAARHAEQAIRAVRLAAPFQLPAEYYNAWKHVSSFRFDRNMSQ